MNGGVWQMTENSRHLLTEKIIVNEHRNRKRNQNRKKKHFNPLKCISFISFAESNLYFNEFNLWNNRTLQTNTQNRFLKYIFF